MRRLSPPGAAFLDRDGTINLKAPEGEYVTYVSELALLPGAAEAIRRLNDARILVIVVTNQRGIALGRMSEQDLAEIHAELEARLDAAAGARIDAFFHCPHDLNKCSCRKPATGMFIAARVRFPGIDFSASVTVGDSASDVEAGRALGMRTLQLGVDVTDLRAAVDQLLAPDNARS